MFIREKVYMLIFVILTGLQAMVTFWLVFDVAEYT